MKLLFKWHTYEIYYKREIIRFISIILTFLAIFIVGVYVKPLSEFIRIILVVISIYLPFMIVWAISRITEIGNNKKKSMLIKRKDYEKINMFYSNSKFLVYVNRRYIECDCLDFSSEELILIHINNKNFKKKHIKEIIK